MVPTLANSRFTSLVSALANYAGWATSDWVRVGLQSVGIVVGLLLVGSRIVQSDGLCMHDALAGRLANTTLACRLGYMLLVVSLGYVLYCVHIQRADGAYKRFLHGNITAACSGAWVPCH